MAGYASWLSGQCRFTGATRLSNYVAAADCPDHRLALEALAGKPLAEYFGPEPMYCMPTAEEIRASFDSIPEPPDDPPHEPLNDEEIDFYYSEHWKTVPV